MPGMIRVTGAQYAGCSVAEALRRLSASDPQCAAITQKAYFVLLNGKQIQAADYENITVKAEDVIMVVSLIAGG